MSDFSDDDFDAAPAPAPVTDAAVVVPCAPRGDVAEHSWRIDVPGATVHAQVIRMVDQLVVWVGAAPPGIAPTHGDVAMALPGRPGSSAGGMPPATTLLGGGAGARSSAAAVKDSAGMVDGASEPMARRLARRTGMCVVCSVNVPLELADLALFAERQVVAKCGELGLFES
mmetsp:Transcript_14459/g.57024  ORF Transcript_14459/g.57024 Transcript_14459/m.57024 type:complete len:171 (-) Transcript_14459:814-1326(-)